MTALDEARVALAAELDQIAMPAEQRQRIERWIDTLVFCADCAGNSKGHAEANADWRRAMDSTIGKRSDGHA